MDAKPTRLNFGQMLVLNAYWVGLSFKWNVLHPIVLPAVLLYLVPEAEKNTWLGILTFVGLILAMIIQPISGALSDRWRSRWGRRRPLALLGTLAEFAFLGLLAWSGGLTWVIIGYLGLQIFSNIAHGPMQGLLPDRVPAEQMGTASSFKNLMDMGGMVVALLAAGNLLSPGEKHPVLIMVVVVGVVAVSAAVTIMGVRLPSGIPWLTCCGWILNATVLSGGWLPCALCSCLAFMPFRLLPNITSVMCLALPTR
jgi:MFS family permease